jgi:hypothetical protein
VPSHTDSLSAESPREPGHRAGRSWTEQPNGLRNVGTLWISKDLVAGGPVTPNGVTGIALREWPLYSVQPESLVAKLCDDFQLPSECLDVATYG